MAQYSDWQPYMICRICRTELSFPARYGLLLHTRNHPSHTCLRRAMIKSSNCESSKIFSYQNLIQQKNGPMVSRERLELSTPGLKGPCSNQLSYRPTTEPHCKQTLTGFTIPILRQKSIYVNIFSHLCYNYPRKRDQCSRKTAS